MPEPGAKPAGTEGEGTPAEGEQPQAAAAEVPGYEGAEAEHAGEEPEAAAGAEAAEGAAEGEAAAEGEGTEKKPEKPRTAGSRDLHKPQFIDFGNPLLVGLLGKMGANLKAYSAIIEERLPAREALPEHQGTRYASEVVVQLYFPAGTASPAEHELSGQENHAAAVA
jgi:hypothetical protein